MLELLDKQLKCSLYGDFERGKALCKELQDKMLLTKGNLYIDTQNAYIKFKQLEEQTINYTRADYNRGWYEMMNGNLLEGFKLMNMGRSANLWGNKHIGTDKPIWRGEYLYGQHVLFICEAGLGDQIMFIRFVNDIAAKKGKVIVACEDYGLGSIFSRMPGVSAVVQYRNALDVYHDYWVPSMGAPEILCTEYKDLSGKPYLTPHPDYVEKFKRLITSDKLKVGIRWLSMPAEGVCNTLGDAYLSRRFPADLMFEATLQDHVQLYSLQRDEGTELLPRMSGIVDLEPELKSWEDTAGAIANLDLVISSCTSVAHLAAAMGKPTWIVVPLMSYFSWSLSGRLTPWYDSVRLFRQTEHGSWDKPFEDIRRELSGFTA